MDNCRPGDALRKTNTTSYITALCFINIIPTLLAIFGNAICIITIIKTPSLHTTSNIWVGALCISDLLVGAIGQPLYYTTLISLITGLELDMASSAMKSAILCMASVSFYLLYLVTVDRYIAICHPFLYRRIATIKRCILGAAFAFALAIPTVILHIFANKFIRYFGPILEAVVFLQILVFYTLIYKAILKQRRTIISTSVARGTRDELWMRKEETRKAYTIGIIIIILLLCYTPLIIASIIAKDINEPICARSKQTLIASCWGWFFMLLNSSINPVFYCLRMRDIRKAAKRIFQCRTTAGISTGTAFDTGHSTSFATGNNHSNDAGKSIAYGRGDITSFGTGTLTSLDTGNSTSLDTGNRRSCDTGNLITIDTGNNLISPDTPDSNSPGAQNTKPIVCRRITLIDTRKSKLHGTGNATAVNRRNSIFSIKGNLIHSDTQNSTSRAGNLNSVENMHSSTFKAMNSNSVDSENSFPAGGGDSVSLGSKHPATFRTRKTGCPQTSSLVGTRNSFCLGTCDSNLLATAITTTNIRSANSSQARNPISSAVRKTSCPVKYNANYGGIGKSFSVSTSIPTGKVSSPENGSVSPFRARNSNVFVARKISSPTTYNSTFGVTRNSPSLRSEHSSSTCSRNSFTGQSSAPGPRNLSSVGLTHLAKLSSCTTYNCFASTSNSPTLRNEHSSSSSSQNSLTAYTGDMTSTSAEQSSSGTKTLTSSGASKPPTFCIGKKSNSATYNATFANARYSPTFRGDQSSSTSNRHSLAVSKGNVNSSTYGASNQAKIRVRKTSCPAASSSTSNRIQNSLAVDIGNIFPSDTAQSSGNSSPSLLEARNLNNFRVRKTSCPTTISSKSASVGNSFSVGTNTSLL